ncbi:hypothetical protein BDY21DRAFT_376196 [Lineolata rhizophorae]|uniref:Uncharacterized protein n=1 Tax=Lineolata rhizophorae TaxID=578093 RepID=A0A6A6PEL5_9PEZI|nr:hypothetical protein BDY21DRAFT_376196 [Lineolata rhizophorae]
MATTSAGSTTGGGSSSNKPQPLALQRRGAASPVVENWDDDGDFQGDLSFGTALSSSNGNSHGGHSFHLGHGGNPSAASTPGNAYAQSASSRLSMHSESNAGDDDWQLLIAPHDESSTRHAISSANQAGIPLPANVPSSALLGGSIKRLGNRKKPTRPSEPTAAAAAAAAASAAAAAGTGGDDWSDDFDFPAGAGSGEPGGGQSFLDRFRRKQQQQQQPAGSGSHLGVNRSGGSGGGGPPSTPGSHADANGGKSPAPTSAPTTTTTGTGNDDDDFDPDWAEGSLGIRFGGTRRGDNRARSSSVSASAMSPSLGSCITADSELDEDVLDGLVLPSEPVDFGAILKKRKEIEYDQEHQEHQTHRRQPASTAASSSRPHSPADNDDASASASSSAGAFARAGEYPPNAGGLAAFTSAQPAGFVGPSPRRPSSLWAKQDDSNDIDPLVGLDWGDGNLLSNKKLKLNRNLKITVTSKRPHTPAPRSGTTLTFTTAATDNKMPPPSVAASASTATATPTSRIPRPMAGAGHHGGANAPPSRSNSRLAPVYESGAQSSQQQQQPGGRSAFSAAQQLLRQKRSAPLLRGNRHHHHHHRDIHGGSETADAPGKTPLVPFLPAGAASGARSHHVSSKASAGNLRREEEQLRLGGAGGGAQSPAPRSFSRLGGATPSGDSPTRTGRSGGNNNNHNHNNNNNNKTNASHQQPGGPHVAPASLVREALHKQPFPGSLLLRRRPQYYGSGAELDGFDDLPTSAAKEARFLREPANASGSANNGANAGTAGPSSASASASTSALRHQGSRSRVAGPTPILADATRNGAGTPAPTTASASTPRSPSRTYPPGLAGGENAKPHFARDTAASRIAREQRLAARGNGGGAGGPLMPVSTNWKGGRTGTPGGGGAASPSSLLRSRKRGSGLAGAAGAGAAGGVRQQPQLIKQFASPKTEKGMTYNAALQRWEGNENALAAFNAPLPPQLHAFNHDQDPLKHDAPYKQPQHVQHHHQHSHPHPHHSHHPLRAHHQATRSNPNLPLNHHGAAHGVYQHHHGNHSSSALSHGAGQTHTPRPSSSHVHVHTSSGGTGGIGGSTAAAATPASPARVPGLISHRSAARGVHVERGMVFDPRQMKWLKLGAEHRRKGDVHRGGAGGTTATKGGRQSATPTADGTDDDEDPFAGLEDLREDGGGAASSGANGAQGKDKRSSVGCAGPGPVGAALGLGGAPAAGAGGPTGVRIGSLNLNLGGAAADAEMANQQHRPRSTPSAGLVAAAAVPAVTRGGDPATVAPSCAALPPDAKLAGVPVAATAATAAATAVPPAPAPQQDTFLGEEFDVGPGFIKRLRDEEAAWRRRVERWVGGEVGEKRRRAEDDEAGREAGLLGVLVGAAAGGGVDGLAAVEWGAVEGGPGGDVEGGGWRWGIREVARRAGL